MRISDWSSDVCSSDLHGTRLAAAVAHEPALRRKGRSPNHYCTGGKRHPFHSSSHFLSPSFVAHCRNGGPSAARRARAWTNRKSAVSGKGVSRRLDTGGRRIHKKKINKHNDNQH